MTMVAKCIERFYINSSGESAAGIPSVSAEVYLPMPPNR